MEALAQDVKQYNLRLRATVAIHQKRSGDIAREHLLGVDPTSDLEIIGESVRSSVESLQRTVTNTTEQIEEAATTIAEKVADAATDSPEIRLGLSIGDMALQSYDPLTATLNHFGLRDKYLLRIVSCGLDAALITTTRGMRRSGFTPAAVNSLVSSATSDPIRREAVRTSWLADILASVGDDSDLPIPARAKLIRTWAEEPANTMDCVLDWVLFEAARRAHTAGRLNLLQDAGYLLTAFGTKRLKDVLRDRILDAEWLLQSREFALLPELQRALAAQVNSYIEQKTLAVGSPDIASHERNMREARLLKSGDTIAKIETKKDIELSDEMKAHLFGGTDEHAQYRIDALYTSDDRNEIILRIGGVKTIGSSPLHTPTEKAFYINSTSGVVHIVNGVYNSAGTKWVCYEARPGDVKIHELLLQLLSFDGTEKTDRGRRWFGR